MWHNLRRMVNATLLFFFGRKRANDVSPTSNQQSNKTLYLSLDVDR